jgi:hypothetical protein
MPLTSDQLDNWFTYHPPTNEQSPKYGAIRLAEQEVHSVFGGLRSRLALAREGVNVDANQLTIDDCDKVNAVTRALVEAIDANAPDSADKTAAIRCVRLARNGANEWIMSNVSGYPLHVDSLALATAELVKARWQANSAIACGGR